ncbi:MAG: protein translocase subunit SecF [Candidatus Kerfeldbacteria bacterium]|nr:protein translocase subunit SecF [Candidatus Kerfeldbacteria bacterium]
MRLVANRHWWFLFSGILVAASLLVTARWGLRFGLDFTGGTLIEYGFPISRPTAGQVGELVKGVGVATDIVSQPLGADQLVLRFGHIEEDTHAKITAAVQGAYDDAKELRYESIGPTIGAELLRKTVWALVIAVVAIIVYIAYSFRGVSKPVPSWQYGLMADLALVHDVTITLGAFAVLGRFYQLEVNAPFIAALLTILGYSVNDTIVVFDRIRENLKRRRGDFAEVVEASLHETMRRSINTSLTVQLSLLAVLLVGGESTRGFALALIIGLAAGTYSSIFLASPLLVVAQRFGQRHRA